MHPLLEFCVAGREARFTIPGAALVDQPSKALEMALHRSLQSGSLAPRASLPPHPLQDSQVTMLSGIIAHLICTPRTAVLSRPLQAFPATVQSGTTTSVFIPRAPLAPQPLQGLQVTVRRCKCRSPLIHQERYLVLWYVAPVRLQHVQIAKTRSDSDDAIHALLLGFGHVEMPAPRSAPVPAEVFTSMGSTLLSIAWPRHELHPGLLLRLTVLLRSQSEGQNVIRIELRRDHRPNLRREPGDLHSSLALALRFSSGNIFFIFFFIAILCKLPLQLLDLSLGLAELLLLAFRRHHGAFVWLSLTRNRHRSPRSASICLDFCLEAFVSEKSHQRWSHKRPKGQETWWEP